MNRAGTASLAVAVLGGLGLISGCSSTGVAAVVTAVDTAPPMPPDGHNLATVLGPLSGTGNAAFTITVRSAMAIELGCWGSGKSVAKDLAWVGGAFGGFAAPCDNSPGNESFAGSYYSAQDLRSNKLSPGQRVAVRITAPANATWRLWITGGPAS